MGEGWLQLLTVALIAGGTFGGYWLADRRLRRFGVTPPAQGGTRLRSLAKLAWGALPVLAGIVAAWLVLAW